MAKSKSYLFDPNDQLISFFAQALSHPARLDILRRLAENGPCTVEKLNTTCPLSQPTLSQHLKMLNDKELVSFREKYPYTIYNLEYEKIVLAKDKLSGFFNFD